MNTLEETDKRLKKFKKVFELWNIIYTFEPENFPQIEFYNKKEKKLEIVSSKNNTSSFCLLGTGLEFEFNEKIFGEYYLRLEVFFSTNLLNELNNDIIILNIKDEINPIKLTMKDIKDKLQQDAIIRYIDIQISDEIKFLVCLEDNRIKNLNLTIPIEFKEFNSTKIFILKNYFGKIEKINCLKVKLAKYNGDKDIKEDIITEYRISPYLLSSNIPYYDERIIKTFKFIDPYLAKINYIKYLEDDFNLIEYILDIKALIPFISLIKGIHQNSKINILNGLEKYFFLKEIFLKIIIIFISILLHYIKKGKISSIKTRKSSKKNEKNEEESELNQEIIDKKN